MELGRIFGSAIIRRETEGQFRKRVDLANVPSFRCLFQGNMRTYPRSGFHSGGTCERTLVPVFVPEEHPPKPPFFCQDQRKHINIKKDPENHTVRVPP